MSTSADLPSVSGQSSGTKAMISISDLTLLLAPNLSFSTVFSPKHRVNATDIKLAISSRLYSSREANGPAGQDSLLMYGQVQDALWTNLETSLVLPASGPATGNLHSHIAALRFYSWPTLHCVAIRCSLSVLLGILHFNVVGPGFSVHSKSSTSRFSLELAPSHDRIS